MILSGEALAILIGVAVERRPDDPSVRYLTVPGFPRNPVRIPVSWLESTAALELSGIVALSRVHARELGLLREWFARGGHMQRMGPFVTQQDAFDSLRLAADPSTFPDDAFVWSEWCKPLQGGAE